MQMTMKLRDDVIALMEEYQRLEGSKGNPLSDSRVSRDAMGYADFVGILRGWTGGKGGPTMEKVARFEEHIRTQVGDEFYKAFMARRAASVLGGDGF